MALSAKEKKQLLEVFKRKTYVSLRWKTPRKMPHCSKHHDNGITKNITFAYCRFLWLFIRLVQWHTINNTVVAINVHRHDAKIQKKCAEKNLPSSLIDRRISYKSSTLRLPESSPSLSFSPADPIASLSISRPLLYPLLDEEVDPSSDSCSLIRSHVLVKLTLNRP